MTDSFDTGDRVRTENGMGFQVALCIYGLVLTVEEPVHHFTDVHLKLESRASDEERQQLLKQLAAGNTRDARTRYARSRLKRERWLSIAVELLELLRRGV